MVPRLTPVSCRELIKFFEAHGYTADRQKGSHLAMVKVGSPRPIIIPMHDEVSVGVVQAIPVDRRVPQLERRHYETISRRLVERDQDNGPTAARSGELS